MKNYLLFDLDGTLTDPKVGICTCVQYALADQGIEEPDLDKLEPFIGPPLIESFMNYYGMNREDGQRAVEKYRERFKDVGILENRIYPGMKKLLKTLHSAGAHLAVASSKPTVFVERILKAFQIEEYFEVVVGSELDGTRNHKSEVVQEALRRLFPDGKILYDQIYMIGDTRFDVEGARECGVESVGVTYGYGGLEQLKEAGADYIVFSVEELREFLMRTLRNDRPRFPLEKVVTTVGWMNVFMLARYFTLRGVISLFGGMDVLSPNRKVLANLISFVVAGGIILIPARRAILKNERDTRLLHMVGESVSAYVLMFIATVGAVIGFNLLLMLSGFAQRYEDFARMQEQNAQTSPFLGLLLYVCVAPIAEELLFRGIFYTKLLDAGRTVGPGNNHSFRVFVAIFISAGCFGFYHGNTVQGIYAFLIGLLLAYMYDYFGLFRVPYMMHVLANLMGWLLPLGNVTGAPGWGLCILALLMMAACLAVLGKRKKMV